MHAEQFQFDAPAAPGLQARRWLPETPPRGTLLIVHGMAEHSGRYARFAAAATARGWAVQALDLPGHGANAGPRGHFADRDGWAVALGAIQALRQRIDSAHPGLPLVLFGHSLGSFLVQHVLVEHGDGLAGAVLSATNSSLGPLRAVGLALMRIEAGLLGPRHPSALAEALSFKAFNRAFAPARTPFDWLSADPAEVDAYLADPACGFRCSAALWADLFAAGSALLAPQRLARLPKRLPVLLICGGRDPVSGGAAGPTRLAAAYRAAGLVSVTVVSYPDGRHELLNEVCREQVSAEVLDWVGRCAAGADAPTAAG